MIWIVLAISAAFLWATGNVISKYTLFKINKETTMIGMLISSVITVAIVYLLFPVSFSMIALLAGIFWYGAYYAYFSGLSENEVSKTSALLLTNPIFTAIISAIILGEILAPIQYFGILISVLGAILLSFEGRIFRKEALIVLASSIMFSISDVGSKMALSDADSISVLFWVRMAAIPILIFLVFAWRKKISFISKKLATFAIGTGLLSDVASYFYIVACSIAFVSLVTAFTTTQALFVFIGATLITRLNSKLLKEEIDKKSLILKISALFLLILGVVLVAL
ncbi:MAG: EamA family transporter [Candidatus Micrarchaeota archaeon]